MTISELTNSSVSSTMLKTNEYKKVAKQMKKPVEVMLRGGQFKQYTEQSLSEMRKKYELKRIELEVICCLARCGEDDTVVSIHEYLNANRGHISQTVFSLCEKGLITAEQDKKDRRYVHYSLTHDGKKIAAEADDVWKRIREEMFAGISDEEMEIFNRVLLKVNENIKAKSK